MLDPLETLTYVAANTNKIALGTSVIDMLFHNPVVLARRFAALDVLSEGRTICGLGIGWSKTARKPMIISIHFKIFFRAKHIAYPSSPLPAKGTILDNKASLLIFLSLRRLF
jgi:hypothetical protein